jgi:hypothetical protein
MGDPTRGWVGFSGGFGAVYTRDLELNDLYLEYMRVEMQIYYELFKWSKFSELIQGLRCLFSHSVSLDGG